jgi:nitrogen regulatory protein PII 2
MKEVIAIIRMNKINETKRALSEAGFPSITCRKVYGRGKLKVEFTMIKEYMTNIPAANSTELEAISEAHRLIPKRYLTLIVQDDEVKKVAETIIEVNQTGSMGDGKIFVLPIVDVIRVRTEEKGIKAV